MTQSEEAAPPPHIQHYPPSDKATLILWDGEAMRSSSLSRAEAAALIEQLSRYLWRSLYDESRT